MRTSIVTVAFVLGLQGLISPAGAADRPAQTDRTVSEMSRVSAEKAHAAAPQPTRIAEDMSADKSFERQPADEAKDYGRAKPIRVYFFFGGR